MWLWRSYVGGSYLSSPRGCSVLLMSLCACLSYGVLKKSLLTPEPAAFFFSRNTSCSRSPFLGHTHTESQARRRPAAPTPSEWAFQQQS